MTKFSLKSQTSLSREEEPKGFRGQEGEEVEHQGKRKI